MIEGSLSRRYTRALCQLAREAGAEEKTGQEVEQFYSAYSQTELQRVLTNPAFGLDMRKKILTQVVEGQQLSALTRHFLSLLLDRDRLPPHLYLTDLWNNFNSLFTNRKY